MPVQLPPELTPVRGLTEWSIDPYALALIMLACAVYLLGVRRVRQASENWPVGRTIAFCAGGAGLAFIATSSFLSVYWPVLFFVRAFQTVVLLLAVPLFIMLGRPLSLVIAAAPRLGPRVEAAIASRVARAGTFPAITGLVLVLTPFVLYYSPWYAAGFHSFAVRELTGLVLVLPGLVFFWTLLRVDPVPRQYPYLVALWVTAAEVVGDAALGLSVIVDRNLIAGGYYHALGRPWGPSLASDQVLGGGALWILGDLIGLPFLAAVLIAMIREDEAEAKVIDAELDAADKPSADEEEAKPWWVADPRFADRFAPVESTAPDQD
ncbi:MAG TPA: cytochrome c oxidase assembly protein [Streptosporangiaceae bacterium]|nr:cytochrome c oxidase assembly protein [Streptosporangiaceae bacterium]